MSTEGPLQTFDAPEQGEQSVGSPNRGYSAILAFFRIVLALFLIAISFRRVILEKIDLPGTGIYPRYVGVVLCAVAVATSSVSLQRTIAPYPPGMPA